MRGWPSRSGLAPYDSSPVLRSSKPASGKPSPWGRTCNTTAFCALSGSVSWRRKGHFTASSSYLFFRTRGSQTAEARPWEQGRDVLRATCDGVETGKTGPHASQSPFLLLTSDLSSLWERRPWGHHQRSASDRRASALCPRDSCDSAG